MEYELVADSRKSQFTITITIFSIYMTDFIAGGTLKHGKHMEIRVSANKLWKRITYDFNDYMVCAEKLTNTAAQIDMVSIRVITIQPTIEYQKAARLHFINAHKIHKITGHIFRGFSSM